MLQACVKQSVTNARLLRLNVPGLSLTNAAWIPGTHARGFFASRKWGTTAGVVPLRKQLKDEKKARKAAASRAGLEKQSEEVDSRLAGWELTVGIEIHAQLNTARKLFSFASTSINASPNTHVAPFDLAVPGTLPIFQKATLIPAVRSALALGCSIQRVSRFDRKHYFYHDQPAGYQITQYYEPFARDGVVILAAHDGIGSNDGAEVNVGIKQIQLEQDTAKSQELDDETYLLDFNRVGHPLIEIISLPQMHSPETASAYVRKVQAILFSVDAVITGMEMGGLRADVNVSVRRRGENAGPHQYSGITGLGQRTEIKNLSTLRGVEDAIKAERDRQIALLEAGGTVEGETRGWSLTHPSVTRRLRGKEGEVDYRYMPDPDISPLIIGEGVVDHLRTTLPLLPDELLSILIDPTQYGLSMVDAKILLTIDGGERLNYFQDVVDALRQAQINARDNQTDLMFFGRLAANWVLHELGSLMTTAERPWSENLVSATVLAELLDQLVRKQITGSSGKQILRLLFEGDTRAVGQIVEEEGLAFQPLSDHEYMSLAKAVMDDNERVVADIRDKGRQGKIMFLVGQMMRRGEDGRVEAKRAEILLRELILAKTETP